VSISGFESRSRASSSYLRQIKKHDLLESNEEYTLAKKWRETMDKNALNKLVSSHLRLVNKIAEGYRGYGLPISELISEGHVGIMQALKKFDPDKGFRLSTYAIWWIKAHIQQYILNTWSLVKIGTTPQQRKLFFNLRKLKLKLGASQSNNMEDHIKLHIAEHLNVSEEEVEEMNRRLSLPDHSLNVPTSSDGEGESDWLDLIVDDVRDQEGEVIYQDEINKRQQVLEESFAVLNPRELSIFKRRRLFEPPETLDVLSQELGISKERVRQIENRAFEKLRDTMHRHPFVIGVANCQKGTTSQSYAVFFII
jgi:RNA polymerase sigma-32 factor